MAVELTKTQLKIRMKNPKFFIKDSFRTDDIGERGRLLRIVGRLKSNDGWRTQAYRMVLKDYDSFVDAVNDLIKLRLPRKQYDKANKLLRKWFANGRFW